MARWAGPAPGSLGMAARRLALLLLLPLLLLGAVHLLAQRYDTTLPPQLMRLQQARWLVAGEPAGEALSLPLQLKPQALPEGATLALDFQLAEPAREPFWLLLQHRPGASVLLDGQLLAQSGLGNPAQADEDDRAPRGLLLAGRRLQVSIPPALLHAGAHRLELRLARPGFEGAGLSPVLLGPAQQMRVLQESRQFWQMLRTVTCLVGLLVGLFMILVWLALRQEWLYGVTGLYCLLSALLLSPYLFNGPPLPPPWWRLALDLADVLAKALLLFLVARLLAWPQRWPQRLALIYALLALPIDGLAAWQGWSWTDFHHPWPWWALGSRALVLGMAAALATRVAWQSGRPAHLVGAVAVALSAWTWAYVSGFALVLQRQFSVVDVNVLGHALLIALAGFALQSRFIASLRAQARAREHLELALARRSEELQARWVQLQDSERRRQAAQERERLLQEMHDGLGSQLVMARLSAERGAPADQLVAQINDCIDEMRLTVDALAVSDGDLNLLLANLRQRLGPRLSQAGLSLDWQLGDVPLLPSLEGTGGRELVRIVQEALSNIIHHAAATRVRFRTRLDEDGGSVSLLVSDNGCGLPARVQAGMGLRSMRQRAARIAAQIHWEAAEDGPGTQLRLQLPLRRP